MSEKNITQKHGKCGHLKTTKQGMSHSFNNYSHCCRTSAVPSGDFAETSSSERTLSKTFRCHARSEFVRKRWTAAAEETMSRRDDGRFEVVRPVTEGRAKERKYVLFDVVWITSGQFVYSAATPFGSVVISTR